MKVRRVTIEIEVPWEFDSDAVMACVNQGFDEIGYDFEGTPVPHQAQVVSDAISTNTCIGSIVDWRS